MAVTSHDSPKASTAASGWSPAARALVSVAILVYLAAVIAPPLAGPPPASDLAGLLIQPLRPLVGGLYLGHGYRFFAPDPGPGHSIRWTLTRRDGSTLKGTIPDAATDRPRLLYHRRFMIPEKIAALVPPPDASEEARREAKRDWQPLVKGIAGQLLERHRGERVELEMVEHYLPAPDEVIRARSGDTTGMDDLVMPLGTYARVTGDGP
jgi:hypothetical protein